MKKKVALILAFCSAFLVLPARTFAAEPQTDVLYIITRTYDEAVPLAVFADAEGVETSIITEDAYSSAIGSRIITTLPSVAKDAKAAGIIPFCVGARFETDANVVIGEPMDASVRLTYGAYTQTADFLRSLRILLSADGETAGTLELTDGTRLPFAAKCSDAWYAPWYDGGGLCSLAMADLIGEYAGTAADAQVFVVIDEIYPFGDLSALRSAADMLYDSGIPFIARVMPVYNNLDYPAFERYADTLRYIQSKNGTVVIHDFLVVADEGLRESPEERLSRFKDALQEQGVHDFPFESTPLILDMDALEKITVAGKHFPDPETDVMIPFVPGEGSEELLARIERKWLSVSDYRLRYTTEKYAYDARQASTDYIYIQEEQLVGQRILAKGNEVLYVVISAAFIVLVVLMFIGRRLYRRKFF